MARWLVLVPLLVACKQESADTADTAVVSTRCEALGLPERRFDPTGTGALNGTAADFTVVDQRGEWTYSTAWSGCDTLVFVLGTPRQNGSFPGVDIWNGDHAALIANSPDNVHYFFVPNDGDNVDARLGVIGRGISPVLQGLSEAERTDWVDRLHYVQQTPSEIGGWLGQALTDPGWGIAIDRAQTVRYVGSFADPERYDGSVGWFAPNLAKLANEARYGNFVVDRQEALDAEAVTELTLFDAQTVQGSGYAEVTLPDLGGFDTLAYDLTLDCVGDGELGDCPAWDYLVYLYQCDDPTDPVDAYATTACQQRVDEVMGACHADGTATPTECRSVDDCEDGGGAVWSCEGHAAAIAAETRPGACESPLGAVSEGTYTCNADGTGFEDLSCPCNTETGRWITTYHREGRWVHDATPFLALLDGRPGARFRFWTSQPYDLTLRFRLSNRGVGYRPTSLTPLYKGAYYNPTVNESYQPLDVAVPVGAAHVELATVISGHGGGQYNCGEFCRTTNHFFVNGTELVFDDPWVEAFDGCEQQVDSGTVPNQYGTWWYGRNGWCPGKEVPIVRTDLSDLVTPGATATFDHETYGPNGVDLNGGNGERIEVDSWMVVYE